MNRVTRSIAIAIALSALIMLAAPVTAAGRIVFAVRVTVVDDDILLGEAADISSVSDDVKADLAARKLGRAPQPDKEIKLARSQVEAKLYNAGIDPSQYQLEIPDTVTFYRKASIVKGSQLLEFAKDYLERNIVWAGGRVRVEFVKEPGSITLPYGTVTLGAVLDRSPNQIGARSFRIDVFLDGEKQRTQTMSAYLEIYGNTLVAARDIPAGTSLSDADLQQQEVRLDQLRSGALTNPDDAIGKKVRRGIRTGEEITRGALDVDPDIAANTIINLVISGEGFVISARGKALEEGFKGDLIRVITLANRKVLEGVIRDSNTVEIVSP